MEKQSLIDLSKIWFDLITLIVSSINKCLASPILIVHLQYQSDERNKYVGQVNRVTIDKLIYFSCKLTLVTEDTKTSKIHRFLYNTLKMCLLNTMAPFICLPLKRLFLECLNQKRGRNWPNILHKAVLSQVILHLWPKPHLNTENSSSSNCSNH